MTTIARRSAAALALLVATIPAQEGFSATEARALQLKSQGRYVEAAEAFVGLLGSAADRTGARDAALAEYHAAMAFNLTEHSGRFAPLREAVTTAAESTLAAAQPWLRDALLRYALQIDLRTGNRAGIAEHTHALGYLEKWTIIGPFDNERGGGFGQVFGPERELDLDASYEGKKRPVHWLRLPIDAVPGGLVDLDALVKPNDQVLCYAAVCLEAERDQVAALHLGSDEAYKVFLNGSEVAARDVRRSFAFDQDAIALPLRAGANLLVLKICEQEGGFAFAARLAAPGGGPLAGVTERNEPDALRTAAKTEPAAGAAAPITQGARSLFAEQIEASDDPHDALRLAYLLAAAGADDPSDRRDHRYALRAVEGLPELSTARFLLAYTRIQPAQHAAEKEENQRRRDYLEILRRDPTHVQALTELAGMELLNLGAANRAEQLARRALATNPQCGRARLILAQALDKLSLDGAAEAALTRGISTAALADQPPDVVRALADLYAKHDRWRDAIDARRTLLGMQYTASNAVSLARLLLRTGQQPAAETALREAIELLPFARAPRLELVKLYEAAGETDRAVTELRSWLTVCPEDDRALVDLARLHGLADKGEQQRELLRTALELNPNLKDERRLLEFLEADEKPFFEEFALDGDAILAADLGAPADAAAENDSHYYLLDQTVVRAYRNGTTSTYRHFIARILTEEGARRLGSHRVPHYWGEQRARLLGARVVKPDGSVQRPRLRGSTVTLPPLTIGDAIEIRSRVDDLAPSFFGDYFGLQHSFIAGDNAPCRRSTLVAILDAGRSYQFQRANGAPEGQRQELPDGTLVVRYEMVDPPRIKLEEQQPTWTETEPLVRITTYRDWNHFSSWWWNLIRKQIQVSPAMQAKVTELTANLTSDADKIAAIYDFVTTEIRYTAWEFGVHGYKPYSTPVIFERRHGDCKDKSLLLNAMLGEVGIPAYPVLIYADQPRSTDDLSLPLIGHFNHCISYLPPENGRPAMFLDGTATYHPTDTIPEMDHGARVLVVKGSDGELEDVPYPDAAANADVREITIALSENGDATVTLSEHPQLNQAVNIRAQLGNEPGKRTEKLERRLTQAFGKVRVRDVQTSDLLATDEAVELRVDFDAPSFASRQDNGLVLKGALEAQSLLPLVRSPERRQALLLGSPRSERTVIRYRLPDGWRPVNLPPPTSLKTRFGTFEMSWSVGDGELRIERYRALDVPRIEPPEYPEFREFATAVDRAERQTTVIKKGSR